MVGGEQATGLAVSFFYHMGTPMNIQMRHTGRRGRRHGSGGDWWKQCIATCVSQKKNSSLMPVTLLQEESATSQAAGDSLLE